MTSLLLAAVVVLTGVAPIFAGTITCPNSLGVLTLPGACAASVNYPAPTISGAASLGCDPASSSVFAVGTTTVGCSAFNGSPPPLILTCEFTVTVTDTQSPSITCPADIEAGSDADVCGGTVEFAAEASDNCGGVVTDVQFGLPSGSVFPVGVTPTTLRATDVGGRTATCEFKVKVTDTTAPTITCPADIVVAEPGPVTYEVQATDNCARVDVELSQPSGSVFRGARTVVGATARDPLGNSSSCTFVVLVGQQPPTTSTTLPAQGCASEPTFASIGCRIGALVPVVSASTTDPVRGRLSRLLDRAGEFLRKAESSQTAGRKRATRTALRKSIARLRRFGKKVLAPKSGVADPARSALTAEAETLQEHLRVLIGS